MNIDELVALWRDDRDPALADAIDLLSNAQAAAPLTGSLAEQIRQWPALLEASLSRALAAFPLGTIDDGSTQLEALAHIDDPRVVSRLLGMLDDPPFRSPASLAFWQRVLAVVEALRDRRAVAWLEHHHKRIEGELAPPMGRLVRVEIERSLARTKKALGKGSSAPQHLELLATLRKKHGANRQAEELLDAIYASPDADGPRLVYADHLLEAGDPRGELIALQLAAERGDVTRDQKKREKELLKTWGQRWLGDLAPVLNKTGLVYRRGFLFGCVFKPNNGAQVERLIGHPAWSTVRHIEMDPFWKFQPIVDRMLLDPVFTSLRTLRGHCSPELLTALAMSSKPRALTSLTVDDLGLSPSISWSIMSGYTPMPPEGPSVPPDRRAALTACPGLPLLRHLELHTIYRVEARFLRWLFDGELGQRLEHLTTRISEAFLPSYIEVLADHPLAVLEAKGEECASVLTFTRGEGGRLDELDVTFSRPNRSRSHVSSKPAAFDAFFMMLKQLAPDALARLTVKWPKKRPPTNEQLDALAELVESRPSLVAKIG